MFWAYGLTRPRMHSLRGLSDRLHANGFIATPPCAKLSQSFQPARGGHSRHSAEYALNVNSSLECR
eukprot:scaffold302277_cov18-Prasinocladus_malaysianus.AAC.1